MKSKQRHTKVHQITGGGNLQLHVEEAGNFKGKPIVFMHEYSQHRLCWLKQIDSTLAEDFRLIFFDLRGHGLSEKPDQVYCNSQLFADDLHAVITTLGLSNPIITGWSYGALTIFDYIRIYGDEKIGGIQLVGAAGKFGPSADNIYGPDIKNLLSNVASADIMENVNASQKFVRLLSHQELLPEDFYFFLGCSMLSPPHVRKQIADRDVNNEDLLAKIRKPVLITHGQKDSIIVSEAAKNVAGLIKHAKVSLYDEVGHMPFWEASPRFNRELRAFANAC
jgi:non-heme chloroperoxidase